MECYHSFYRKNKLYRKGKNLIERACLCCGGVFYVHPYRLKSARFCSIVCWNRFRQIKLNCPSCNKTFISPKWEKRRYCSLTCAHKGVQRTNGFSSQVEIILSKYKSIPEKTISIKNKKYFVDFLVCDKICVECDGQYWHCDPRVYPPNYFHKQIRKTSSEIWKYHDDKESDLKSVGYSVIRVKEYDWLKDRQATINWLIGAIDAILKG
jgi:hypothetical protein